MQGAVLHYFPVTVVHIKAIVVKKKIPQRITDGVRVRNRIRIIKTARIIRIVKGCVVVGIYRLGVLKGQGIAAGKQPRLRFLLPETANTRQ